MKISLNWLKQYIETDITPLEMEQILTSIGLEVESSEQIEELPGSLEGVVTGKVVECVKHPGADKLSLTKVDVGTGTLLNIVCGAPNVAVGQKVLVATVGAELTFSNGEKLKIKRSKIRGEESQGMICAEDELGLGTSHEGIMVLPNETTVGLSAKEYLNLKTDTLFEIGLTPNRIDAASHYGVARDLHAYLKFHRFNSKLTLPATKELNQLPRSSNSPIELDVVAIDGAPKYYGVTLDNIKVEPSPEWLQRLLRTIGVRPINNVVDITNFVLHEYGHPLHAFDGDKIRGKKVVVRRAVEGESIVTLDGVERKLSNHDLMICDIEKPMCIAGLFGGDESGVSDNTTSLFLESAYFDPISIRKSSKRHSLKTDASFRFERGANPNGLEYAMRRAVDLLVELTGAKICGEPVRVENPIETQKIISLDYDRMGRLIGKRIGPEEYIELLTLLEFSILERDTNGVKVMAPSYRVDVTRECDVVEELLRIYGYNNIELPSRMSSSVTPSSKPDPERVRTIASELLVNNGFCEIMNNSLTKSEYYAKLTKFPMERLVLLKNPLSSDLNAMRQTLLLSGLEVIAHNINRQHHNLKLFEFGNTYGYATSQESSIENSLSSYTEGAKISLFVTGDASLNWRGERALGSFYLLKGYVETLLRRFGIDINECETAIAPTDIFEEGLTLLVRGKGKDQFLELGYFGTIKKSLSREFDIKQQVFAAEFDWDLIFSLSKRVKTLFTELPKYPSVTRDLALLIDESVSYSDLRKGAYAAEKRLLKEVTLFDVYRGDKIPEGKKQYAISFVLQDTNKTLTDREVEDVMNRLLTYYMNTYNATLR